MNELPPFRLHGPEADDLAPGTWLLEASAGTGKTYTIVGILLRLIAEAAIPIERCVVMTFTRAATAELRERIRAGLHGALRALEQDTPPADAFLTDFRQRHRHDAAVHRRLLLAVAGLDAALIATIHGVCHRLLGDHALHAGVPLRAELDADLEAWRSATVHDLLRDWTHRLHPDCGGLVGDALDPEALQRRCALIERDPTMLLEGADAVEPEAIGAALEQARSQWSTWSAAIRTFYQTRAAVLGGAADYQPAALQRRLERIGALLQATPATEDLRSELLPLVKPNHGKKRLGREHLTALTSEVWWTGLTGLLRIAPGVQRAVVAEYRRRLVERPGHSDHLSFSDLLLALERSSDGPDGAALRRAVARRYDLVLVDEFQDTDPLQWRILDRLFTGPDKRLFLIGDPKQAIYAFRGADVHAYLQVAGDLRTDTGGGLRARTLGRNFRSDAGLVAAINHCFDRGSDAFVERGIRFQPVAAQHGTRLRLTAELDPRPLQCWWQEPAAAIGATRRALAAAVAREIPRLLVGGQRQVAGDWRPLAPRDIAVLVRSHGEAALIAEALAALPQPVPAVRNLRSSVCAGRTAFDCAVLLEAVLTPQREPAVRAAACTGLCGLPPSALVAPDAAAGAALVARLQVLRERWRQRGFIAMWQDLLDHGCGAGPPRQLLAARVDGERAITDLLHLGELLEAAERQQGLGPEALLRWLQRALADPGRSGEEQLLRLDRDDDAVRICTIHASKGLQFPIVFVPFLWTGGRAQSEAIYHSGHRARWHFGPTPPASVQQARRRAVLAEDCRLAYVALTRAEHRCYVALAPQPSGRGSPGCSTAPLIWLAAGAGRHAPEDFAALVRERLTDPDWRAELHAAFAHEHCAVAPPPEVEPPTRPVPAGEAVQERPVADWSPRPRSVYFSSYSGLVRDRPVDEPDHDQIPPAGSPEDLLPRGARFGTALHAVFEYTDFDADAATIRAACQRELAAQGFEAEHAPRLAALVERVLAAPVPGLELALRQVARQRAAEMDVLLPVSSPGRLADAFAVHGGIWADYATDIGDLLLPGGYFTGIIDLVFSHAGRLHLADWKSNDLSRRGGYGQEAMTAEMHHHHYVLQYHLYLVALHRLLRLRLPDYDYERHIGAAHYVFVRGVDGSGAGWYHHRPSAAMIAALDACFGAMP